MQIVKHKLKIFFLFPVFMIIFIAVYYLLRPALTKNSSLNVSTSLTTDLFRNGLNLKMEKPRIISDNNGRKEWEIEADSITGSLDQITNFKKIRVKFFPADQKIITASAENGKINNQTKNMEMRGSVVVNSEKFILKSQVINWNAGEKVMETNSPIEIYNSRFEIKGDSLITDADFSRIRVKGAVRALSRKDRSNK